MKQTLIVLSILSVGSSLVAMEDEKSPNYGIFSPSGLKNVLIKMGRAAADAYEEFMSPIKKTDSPELQKRKAIDIWFEELNDALVTRGDIEQKVNELQGHFEGGAVELVNVQDPATGDTLAHMLVDYGFTPEHEAFEVLIKYGADMDGIRNTKKQTVNQLLKQKEQDREGSDEDESSFEEEVPVARKLDFEEKPVALSLAKQAAFAAVVKRAAQENDVAAVIEYYQHGGEGDIDESDLGVWLEKNSAQCPGCLDVLAIAALYRSDRAKALRDILYGCIMLEMKPEVLTTYFEEDQPEEGILDAAMMDTIEQGCSLRKWLIGLRGKPDINQDTLASVIEIIHEKFPHVLSGDDEQDTKDEEISIEDSEEEVTSSSGGGDKEDQPRLDKDSEKGADLGDDSLRTSPLGGGPEIKNRSSWTTYGFWSVATLIAAGMIYKKYFATDDRRAARPHVA